MLSHTYGQTRPGSGIEVSGDSTASNESKELCFGYFASLLLPRVESDFYIPIAKEIFNSSYDWQDE